MAAHESLALSDLDGEPSLKTIEALRPERVVIAQEPNRRPRPGCLSGFSLNGMGTGSCRDQKMLDTSC